MMENNIQIRYCKKCGTELPMDTKGNKCRYCKADGNEKAKKIGVGVFGVLAAVGSVAVSVASIVSKNKKNS